MTDSPQEPVTTELGTVIATTSSVTGCVRPPYGDITPTVDALLTAQRRADLAEARVKVLADALYIVGDYLARENSGERIGFNRSCNAVESALGIGSVHDCRAALSPSSPVGEK